MKKAAAIVTNRGGRTCHAAIVSRELGVPAIVGTEHGTEVLHDGQTVTVSLRRRRHRQRLRRRAAIRRAAHRTCKDSAGPRTKIMMNVGNPEEAFRLSFIPNDGVGLAREEFIITTYIKIHPLALLDYRPARPTPPVEGRDRPADRRLRRQAAVLRRQAGRRRRDDRRRVLSEGRDRPAERLQDERIRQPDRRHARTSRTKRTR